MNTESYREYLKSHHWQMLRRQKVRGCIQTETHVFCRGCKCMVPRRRMEVHHRTYVRVPYRERLDDLVVLCQGCHAFVHGIEGPMWWQLERQRGNLGKFSMLRLKKRLQSEIRMRGRADAEEIIKTICHYVSDQPLDRLMSKDELNSFDWDRSIAHYLHASLDRQCKLWAQQASKRHTHKETE